MNLDRAFVLLFASFGAVSGFAPGLPTSFSGASSSVSRVAFVPTVRVASTVFSESEQAADCAMEVILRSIITGQNAQIQAMRGILEAKNFPPENDCVVEASSSDDVVSSEEEGGLTATIIKSSAPSFVYVFGITVAAVVSAFLI